VARLALPSAIMASGCGEPAATTVAQRLGALPEADAPLDALARRNGRLRERLALRGYELMERQARVFVLESHGVAIPVDLDVSRCHTFAALGSSGLRELHAILYDGEGVEVAADAIPREGALVHTCPQPLAGAVTMPHHLVLFASAGTGSVAVTEAESLPGTGEGFEGIFDEILAPSVPFRDVEQALTRSRTALRARGLSPVGEPEVRTLFERGAARADLPVEEGRCYVSVARGGEGVEDLDLFLFDADGVEVARDLSRGAEASIEHCATESATYAVEVRAYRGSGAVGLASFEGTRGAAPAESPESRAIGEAIGVGPERDDPVVELSVSVASLVEQGFDEPVVIARSAVITPGEVLTHDVAIGPGCGLVVAVGSNAAMDLDLYLADPNGREIDVDTDTRSHAVVRACAPTASVMRAAVKVYGHDGTYALGVVRAPRAIIDVPSLRLVELTAEPRARGYEVRVDETRELEESGRAGGQTEIAPGRCVVVAVAGRGELTDVDLELRNVEGRVLASDSGPAPHATSGWCAPVAQAEPFVIVWEARAYRGAGSVRVQVMEGPP
ncbi:MAG: hypothetical protein K1X94_32240, partial [Sandaracinaceae bacterium]|nr:hypothetical protein [Sandaracinaceae bacterium]